MSMQVGQRVRMVKGEGAGKVGEVVGTVPNGKIRVKKEEGPPWWWATQSAANFELIGPAGDSSSSASSSSSDSSDSSADSSSSSDSSDSSADSSSSDSAAGGAALRRKKRAKKAGGKAPHQCQLLRSQPFCLHPSMTFETTLHHLLSFFEAEEVAFLCFEVGAVRGDDLPVAWRAVCKAAAAEHVFLSVDAGVDFPGGWNAFYVDRCDPYRLGFWREKAAAEAAAKAEVVALYPDLARMNEPCDEDGGRCSKRCCLRWEVGSKQATKELVQLCSLPAAVQRQPGTLLRVRELIVAGANPNESNRGPDGNASWSDTVQDKCLYAVKSVKVAQMLLAAGAHPNGGASWYGRLSNDRGSSLEELLGLTDRVQVCRTWSPRVRHVLDVQEEFDSAKPADLRMLLRRHGSSSSPDSAAYRDRAEVARSSEAYRVCGEVECALESSVAELESKLEVAFNKKQLKSFAGGDPRILEAKQRNKCAKTRRTLRRGRTAQQLEALDSALLAECARENCDNARVLSLLLQGALPEYHEDEAYWPCPMSKAVEACNLGALRLLLAAGGDINTCHLEATTSVNTVSLLHIAEDVEGMVDWLEKQRPPAMTVMLEAMGIMHRDDFASHDWDFYRFDDMECYEF